ncbi:MAG: chloride channel protein [Phycisphaeraceae bacterium]|nr:chloride channel protein [Phycisphaeraceae bacterium]
MGGELAHRVQTAFARLGLGQDWTMIILGAGAGVVTALGAIGFIELVHLFERLARNAQVGLPLLLLPLIPMLGALLTALLVRYGAREAQGHGVPEVMDAVIRRQGKVRPRLAVVKSLASACTIGSGGSAGAEGPIVQIGAALGSGLAQLLKISREQATTLLGCGAAAGIASVFNAPIAGVFFVLEILLRDFSLKTFTPIVVASVFSAAVTQAVLGQNEAIFAAGDELQRYVFTLSELPSYVVLGLVCGAVAVAFAKTLYKSEDLFEKMRLHPLLKPVLGALLLGALGVAFMVTPGLHGDEPIPAFFGNGYDSIRALLDPVSYTSATNHASGPSANRGIHGLGDAGFAGAIPVAMWALLLLCACKIVATSLTLGSGGSGGVFAPSLFIGAAAGAAFGVGLDHLGLLPEGGSPAAYALVGMAAVVAGTTHAPLTAMLMLFEITRDVYVLLPIMLAAVVSTVVAQLLARDSIYSLKLRRKGVRLGSAGDWTILRKLIASDADIVPGVAVNPDDPLSALITLAERYRLEDFVVVDKAGHYAGVVTGQDLRTALIEREALPLLVVSEVMRTDLPTVHPDEPLDSVMAKFSTHDAASLAVLSADGSRKVEGVLTRSNLMSRYQRALAETA